MKTSTTLPLVAATVALIVMLSATAQAIKVHQDLNMQDANLINAGGNNITNVAPGVEDMDAVNVSQLTNATGNTMAELNALSNYIQNTMITGVANYAYLTGQVNDTYVNVDGDTMTGPLTISNNLTVNGKIYAADIYALTQTVLNITISNQCIIATNLQVQGIIDGVVGTNIPSSAVTYAQLTNALANAGIDIAGATNALWQTTVVYIDGATNAIGVVWDGRWVNVAGDNMTGGLGMGGNNITNMAPGVDGMDAVNVSQLEGAVADNNNNLNALSNYIQGTMITSVANYAYLTGQVNDTYVNVDGDTMTGPLTINNNLTVNGKIYAADIYALTQTVLNITISNQCIIATNLQVQGIIDGVVGTNIPSSAVNYAQLTNALANAGIDIAGATNALWQTTVVYIDGATNAIGVVWDGRWVNVTGDNMTGILGMGGNRITNMAPGIANNDAATLGQLNAAVAGATNVVSLQHAYNTGNTIATTAGKGNVAISGTQKLAVSAAGGVEVSGGNVNVTGANNVQVDGPSGGQVRVNGANESVGVNGAGKMVIYSGGVPALEFE
ncbi:MAG: hypothetical protein NTV22_09915 [bacterium]|nr:hypothetical protein [bacterium]